MRKTALTLAPAIAVIALVGAAAPVAAQTTVKPGTTGTNDVTINLGTANGGSGDDDEGAVLTLSVPQGNFGIDVDLRTRAATLSNALDYKVTDFRGRATNTGWTVGVAVQRTGTAQLPADTKLRYAQSNTAKSANLTAAAFVDSTNQIPGLGTNEPQLNVARSDEYVGGSEASWTAAIEATLPISATRGAYTGTIVHSLFE